MKKKIRVKHSITATTVFGLENILAEEIRKLGGTKIKKRARAVVFEGDRKLLYQCNFNLRTAIRILKPVCSFQFKSQDEFYFMVREFNWPGLFKSTQSFTIDSVVFSKIFSNSQYCTLKAKDAIVDKFRHDRNARPNIDRDEPDFRLHLHVHNQDCTISLDSSGLPLNQRGYRKTTGPAPINEVLAAGMIYFSGWQQNTAFVNPMCGSGTLAIEAAMIMREMAPGLIRNSFAFQKWSDYNGSLYNEIVQQARDKLKAGKAGLIFASDIDPAVLRSARENMRQAGVLDLIELHEADFMSSQPKLDSGYLVINPPYGERLRPNKIGRFYKQIGDSLAEHYSKYNITIISSNEMALESIGLKIERDIEIQNGPLDCRLQELSCIEE